MSVLKSFFIKHKHHPYLHLFIVLLLFACIQLLSLLIFYNGFTVNFKKILPLLSGGTLTSVLSFVPYYSFSICISSLLHPLFLITLLLLAYPYLKNRKKLVQQFVPATDRIIVFVSAFILSWELCTYDFNYYLNSAFYFDRILLIIFPFLLFRWPSLSVFFVAIAFVYRSQFNYPVDGFDLFDKRLLFDVLILFVAHAYVQIYVANLKINFLFLVICLVASNYFVTGLSKIAISPHGYEWLFENKLSDFFLNMQQRGWMQNVSIEKQTFIYTFLNKYSIVLQLIILSIEVGAIVILRNYKFTMALLIGFVTMHLAIFFVAGILFWKWIIIDVMLFVLIIKHRAASANELFTSASFKMSIVVILSSFIWLRPYTIGWFDTKLNQFFVYEVEDNNGGKCELNKNEFNPYHQWIQYDKLLFLVNHEVLNVSGFGYTSKYATKSSLDNVSPETLPDLVAHSGANKFDQKKTDAFKEFLLVCFKNKNLHQNKTHWYNYLCAPNHLNGSDGCEPERLKLIKKVRVYYCMNLNSNGIVIPVKKEEILSVNI